MTTPENTGSLAEEARRLAEALGLRATAPPAAGHPPPPQQSAPAAEQAEAQAAGAHSPTCSWCPLCRGVDSIRQVDPEAVERLADAVSALAAALGEVGVQLRERLGAADRAARPAEPHARTAGASERAGGAAAYDIPVLDDEIPDYGDIDQEDEDEQDDRVLAADEEE